MPSHKEILQARVAEAEEKQRAVSAEEERLRSQVNETTRQIAEAQERYEKACLAAAQGTNGEDAASVLAERDRHSHRLRGLEQLYKSALDAHQTASLNLTDAQVALNVQLDLEEGERLKSVIADAEKKRDSAKAAHDQAVAAVNNALWAHRQFLVKLGKV